MRVSFIIPRAGQYTENKCWLWWVYKELEKLRNEVLLNTCDKDCDVIICMSISQRDILLKLINKYPKIPFITYNWDWLSFIDKTKGEWPEFIEYMKRSLDIWTPTQYMVDKMKNELGLKHHIIKPCSVIDEFKGETKDDSYVVQASRRDKRYKNFDFFEKGCEALDIPYISCHPKKYNREEYIEILRKCRLLVVASTEDANTALSATEAAYFKKPLLLSDIEPHKEEWKESAVYFKNNIFIDFKEKLKGLYNGDIKADVNLAYEIAMKDFTPKAMANSINKRLKEIL